MADWEEFVISELDSEFIVTKSAIVLLGHMSHRLRKGGTQCNALADKCDIAANNLRRRIFEKENPRVGRHRAAS